MEIRHHASLDEFRAAADPFYRRDPVTSTVELTMLHSQAPPEDALLLTVWDAELLVGTVIQTPPYPLLCSRLPEETVGDVAQELARIRPQSAGVRGLRTTAMRFADTWQAVTGCRGTVGMEERLYRLTSLQAPTGVEGAHRAATEADSGLLDTWFTDFQLEAFGRTIVGARRSAHTVLWTVDGAPASMARVGRPIAGVSRIGPVFTPVDRRGRGYGSAVTAAAAQWALDAGADHVVLFTDLANPVSNSIYQRIGFEPVSDWLRIDFAAGS
jgi:predicted GNAT family acetyltransferase